MLSSLHTAADVVTMGVDGLCGDLRPWQIAAGAVSVYVVSSWLLDTFVWPDEAPLVRVKRTVFRLARKMPAVRRRVEKELAKAEVGFRHSLLKAPAGFEPAVTLPASGLATEDLLARVTALAEFGDPQTRMTEGRVSGTLYVGGEGIEVGFWGDGGVFFALIVVFLF